MLQAPWRRIAGAVPLVLSLLLAPSAAPAQAPHAAPLPEGWLVVTDQVAFSIDPVAGPFWGGIWVVDPDVDAAPENSTFAAESELDFPLPLGVAVLSRNELLVADASTDPAGLGTDGNPGDDSGHGAILIADSITGQIRVLSDGTLHDPTLTPPAASVFAHPADVLVLPDGDLLVADADADPSGLGPDPGRLDLDPMFEPHVGYGALLRVDLDTGRVTLVADGTGFPGPFPDYDGNGPEPSIFLDPWALADDPTDADAVFLLDLLADPAMFGVTGTVFRVTLSTGAVEAVSSAPEFGAPTDLAWKASLGGLLVVDALPNGVPSAPGGALFQVTGSPGSWSTSVWATPDTFSYPWGIVVDEQDTAYVIDFDADPFAANALGAVWEMQDADLENPLVVSSSIESFALTYGASVPTGGWPTIVTVDPDPVCCGVDELVTITGSGFVAETVVRGETGLVVLSYRRLSGALMEATVRADCATATGTRRLRVVNPGVRTAAITVEVIGAPGETEGLRLQGPRSTIVSWTPYDPPDPGLTYDLIRGLLSDLHGDGDVMRADCYARQIPMTVEVDPQRPPENDGFYYLVRAGVDCQGPYGPPELEPYRTTDVCD